MKYSYEDYTKLLSLSFKDKVLRSEQLISYELKKAQRPMIANSWGKDSMILVHLIRKFCKNVLIVFHNTGVQYPETYKYRDLMLKEWNIKNYVETKPIKDFWFCVKKYGYPKYRQMSKQGKNRTPKCCYYLKEKPAINFIKENKIDLNFVGLQASESMVRRLSFLREGENFNSKKYNTRIIRPLMIWTDKDVWKYHELNKIPKNPTYEIMKRNGCMPCSAFKGWREVMIKANPDLYAYISKDMGQPLITEWCK